MIKSFLYRKPKLKKHGIAMLNWHQQTFGSSMLRWPQLPGEILHYLGNRRRYIKLASSNGEKIDTYPILYQRGNATFDAQYTYQAIWAMQNLRHRMPTYHVDISSDIRFVTQLSVWIPVIFLEYRRMPINGCNLSQLCGDLAQLPFRDKSISSLSCLHVIEHIGLGRYGDTLDVEGPGKALAELYRVLAPGGVLLITTPVGQQRTLFNAHRIFHPKFVIDSMHSLELSDFSIVKTNGEFIRNVDPQVFVQEEYACGMYLFVRN